jgi:lysophospholipase L1-like esterase
LLTKSIARLLATFASAILLASAAACAPKSQDGEHDASDNPGTKATNTEATDAPESATTGKSGATSPDATASWDYVALGDSIAAGVGARQGYVDRYADDVRADAGARVRITNLGISGQTSAQLLRVLRSDASARRAISGAEVITFNIGINDLGRASGQYEAETCGGARNQRCLRSAVRTLEENWDAITEEILGLRSTDEAIVRTVGLGYTPRVDGVFRSYLQEANRHIAASTAESRIPYAEVSLGADGLGPDGLHPDGSGYYEIANQLRRLGYHPLQPH